MASIKYQCNNCDPKHYFDGDKFTSVCPRCESENIEQLKDDKFAFYLKYIQDNWKIVAPVLIGLFLIFLWLGKEPTVEGGTSTVYVVDNILQKDNYLEITMSRWDSSDGRWKMSKESLSESMQIDKISKHINFLSITGESKQIIPIDNKIYLCDKDTGSYLSMLVEYKSQIIPLRFKKPISFEFHLNGIQPDSKANCDEVCNIESKNIRLSANNCTLKVNIKNVTSNRTLLVSINGINGDYKPKTEWDIKPIKKYDVWVKYENSTCSPVGSIDNNGTPPISSCKECKSDDLSREFGKLLNAWGKDPNNRDLQIPCNTFYKGFIGGNNKFIVNGKVFRDWSDMEQKITNEAEDDKKTFVLKNPVLISKNCTEVTIEFIYD
jgi:hypothetical protein